LGVQHKFTRPCRPQTNGKAEQFIQCQRSASRPMTGRTRTQLSGPILWRAGSTTTTDTGRTAASVTSLRCPGSNLQITS
jgi:transposase InsO family protein